MDSSTIVSRGVLKTSRASFTGPDNRRSKMEDERVRRRIIFLHNSTSSVSEYDFPQVKADRRDSAPECDLDRVSTTQNSDQALQGCGSAQSLEAGSCPLRENFLKRDISYSSCADSLSIDNQSLQMQYNRSVRASICDQSIQTGQFKWNESTLDTTTSLAATLNSRQLKFKVILLGDSGVGKSSFLRTLLCGKFTSSKSSTNLTMSSGVKMMTYIGIEVELEFCDTAGQERFRSLTPSYYRHAHGCLLFFNVNTRKSFEHVESWLDDLNKYGNRDHMAVVLVGLCHGARSKPAPTDQHGRSNNLGSVSVGILESWSDLGSNKGGCNIRAVSRAQAEHLATHCFVPYIEADMVNDHASVMDTVHKLLDLLLTRAVQNSGKALCIKPSDENQRRRCCSTC